MRQMAMSTDPQLRLGDLLSQDRIVVDADGGVVKGKPDALRILSHKLAPAVGTDHATIERLLADRERLQSTGIGDGVAVPHTSIESATRQAVALLLCPNGVPFDAIDGADVNIIFGVVGPRRATGGHLRVLARISRLLRDAATRSQLVQSATAEAAHRLILQHDESLR
jgi:PTS system nitrogen regulatory IIA component